MATLLTQQIAQHIAQLGKQKFMISLDLTCGIMATALPNKWTAIFADSFLNGPNRLFGYRFISHDKISVEPHMDNTFNFGKILNLAQGSATLETDNWLGGIGRWANNLPDLTVVALGGCDLSNTPTRDQPNICGAFRDKILKFLNELRNKGRERAAFKEEYDQKMTKHLFLIIGVPKWGPNTREDSIGGEALDKLRRKANTALTNAKPQLWRNFKAVVFHPEAYNPHYDKFNPGTTK